MDVFEKLNDKTLLDLVKQVEDKDSKYSVKPATIVFVFNKDKSKVLLGFKKRGFGKHLWNGFGGKIEINETDVEAAKRELFEESGLVANELVKCGVLYFKFENDPVVLTAHVFWTTDYNGSPIETEEMRPQWFSVEHIPFDNMWNDDIFWFDYMLKSHPFVAIFMFKADLKTITSHNINSVSTSIVNSLPVFHTTK